MRQPIKPVLIYTQFHEVPLPERSVGPLLNYETDLLVRYLISLKMAIQYMSRHGEAHPLVDSLYAALPVRIVAILGRVQPSLLTNQSVVLQIIVDLKNEPARERFMSTCLDQAFFATVFDTILLYNEHHFRESPSTMESFGHDDVWRIALMQEINAENPLEYNRLGASRQLIFDKFLQLHLGASYSSFHDNLLALTGLPSLMELILIFIHLELAYEKAVKNRLPLVVIPPEDNRYELLQKLNLVIDWYDTKTDYHVPDLITSPFIRLSDKKLYLTGTADFGLITTRSWEYYLVESKAFEHTVPAIKTMSEMQAFLGKRFVEEYVVTTLLKSLEKPGVRFVKPTDDKLPDAVLIVNEKDVFIFEVKTSSLHKNVVREQSVKGYQKFIDDNFVTGKKGVTQLNRNITDLVSNGQRDFNIKNSPSKLRVYPIILYTEPHLTKMGVNDYLKTHGPALPATVKGAFQVVEDITMIPLNFFLDNLRILQADRTALRSVVSDYHRQMRAAHAKYNKTKHPGDFVKAMNNFEAFAVNRNGMYRDSRMVIFDCLGSTFALV